MRRSDQSAIEMTMSRTAVEKALSGTLTIVFAILLGGCFSNKLDHEKSDPLPKDSAKIQASAALAPGDSLSFAYQGAPEMNLSQRIRADGRVSLPMIGDVAASGRTLSSFQSYLKSAYKEHLQESSVVVTLVTPSAGIYVYGAVSRPGKIVLDRPMTVLQAIGEAGGFSPTANPAKVSVIRQTAGQSRRYNLDFGKVFEGGAPVFYLRPSDTIYVGARTW